jgi:CBS domain-containing membrane protein
LPAFCCPVSSGVTHGLPSAAGGRLGWARGAIGALIGIAVAGVLTRLIAQSVAQAGVFGPSLFGPSLFGTGVAGLPWLVAPLGAAAVLVSRCRPARWRSPGR